MNIFSYHTTSSKLNRGTFYPIVCSEQSVHTAGTLLGRWQQLNYLNSPSFILSLPPHLSWVALFLPTFLSLRFPLILSSNLQLFLPMVSPLQVSRHIFLQRTFSISCAYYVPNSSHINLLGYSVGIDPFCEII